MQRIPWCICTLLVPVLLPLAPATRGAEKPDALVGRTEEGSALRWFDIRQLGVEGRGWTDTKSFYDRLPARAEGTVRGPVWSLSQHSAGLCTRFVTDATTLHARWALRSKNLAMPHMPATGVSGVDLYVKTGSGSWRWLATGRPTKFPTNTARLFDGLPAGRREFILYLPLYNGVTQVDIGLPPGASLSRLESPGEAARKPIVFYGTSITQGGCASRPGMVHTAILGRWLDHPVINLGFSGNGRMEPEMATLIAELDPAVFVLDCLPNMGPTDVAARVVPFVHTLRKKNPKTPILLVEDRTYADAFLVASRQRRCAESRAELRKALACLTAEKVAGLSYLPGAGLLGEDGEDTVDGSHPTDLGFWRQAKAFRTALEPILGPAGSAGSAPVSQE